MIVQYHVLATRWRFPGTALRDGGEMQMKGKRPWARRLGCSSYSSLSMRGRGGRCGEERGGMGGKVTKG